MKDGKKFRISKKTKEVIVTVALEATKADKQESEKAVETKAEKTVKKPIKKKVVKSTAKKNEDA
jgi:hypothetical protein